MERERPADTRPPHPAAVVLAALASVLERERPLTWPDAGPVPVRANPHPNKRSDR